MPAAETGGAIVLLNIMLVTVVTEILYRWTDPVKTLLFPGALINNFLVDVLLVCTNIDCPNRSLSPGAGLNKTFSVNSVNNKGSTLLIFTSPSCTRDEAVPVDDAYLRPVGPLEDFIPLVPGALAYNIPKPVLLYS